MAFSSLSRKLLSSLRNPNRILVSPFTNRNPNPVLLSVRFSTTTLPGADSDVELDDSNPSAANGGGGGGGDDASSNPNRPPYQRLLENGLDPGVYKAIMVGKVGQKPVQKQLRSGRTVVLFSLGTGGIRNNRRPLEDEEPREYADRCSVQWHRVSVYPERLGNLALQHVKPGSVLYMEGNLETKVFSDPITGLVRRIREIAIRGDGRLVFLGSESDGGQVEPTELKRVGYY